MPGSPWTESEIDILVQHYPRMQTGDFMHLLPCRTYKAISAKAERLELHKRPGALRRCDIDDSFFSDPTPLSAYWAGFLAADGYIDGYNVCLAIHEKDLRHLEAFRDMVAPRKRIGISGKRVSLGLCSPRMCDDLACIYGIVPRKSLILPAPRIDDEDCVVGYIAGLFDGDGSVTGRWLSFLGTQAVMNWVRSWFDYWSPGRRRRVARVYRRGKICGYKIGVGRAMPFVDRARVLGLPVLRRKWDRIVPPTPPENRANAVRARERQRQAWVLRRGGHTYQSIANRLGYAHRHSARSAVLRAMERYGNP